LTSIAGSLRRIGLTAEEIFAALWPLNLRRCRPPYDEANVRRIATSIGRYPPGTGPGTEDAWPAPKPLPDGLLPVPALDVDRLLPTAFAPWVRDLAARIGCPPEYIAVTVLSAASAVIGRRLSLFPLTEDRDWRIIPNTWAAVVGPPGAKKTPAQRAALKPFQRLIAQERTRYEERVRDFEAQEVALQAEVDDIKARIKGAVKKGEPTDALQAQYTALSTKLEEQTPRERRLSANDTTVEKLAVLLAENPRGIFVFRDELLGLIRSLDREGHEGDQAFFNEGWDGNYASRVDRVGRGTLVVPANCLTLCGGIPPEPLQAYLVEVQRKRSTNDGFVSRFQLLVYPDLVPQSGVDRRPDEKAAARVQQVFEALDRFTGVQVRAEQGPGDEPPFLRFTAEAQQIFAAWRTRLDAKVRAETEPLMQSHLAKYFSLVASLALIFHVIETLDPEGARSPVPGVSRPALERALGWAEFLEAHARRIFEAITAAPRFAAVALGQRLLRGAVPDGFQARKIHRKGWSRLTTPEDVAVALDVLEELGWVAAEEVPSGVKGGRPTRLWRINPQIERESP
jgi:putative DNA primase/helicase